MNELIKLNYDDYYKFLTSLGIVGFLFISGIIYYLGSNRVLTSFVSFGLIIFIIIFIILILAGMLPWRNRQKNLDKLLSLEVSEKELTVKQLDLDMKSKQLEKKESDLRLKEKHLVLNKLPEKIE
jgi:hypothetical protein